MPTPPMSNAERQRRFRKRNPGYYGRLHRKRKAAVDALVAARAAEAAALAAQAEPAALPAPVEVPALPVKTPLLLPAPVRDPAMEAIDALAASLKVKSAAREPIPLPHKPATPPEDDRNATAA